MQHSFTVCAHLPGPGLVLVSPLPTCGYIRHLGCCDGRLHTSGVDLMLDAWQQWGPVMEGRHWMQGRPALSHLLCSASPTALCTARQSSMSSQGEQVWWQVVLRVRACVRAWGSSVLYTLSRLLLLAQSRACVCYRLVVLCAYICGSGHARAGAL